MLFSTSSRPIQRAAARSKAPVARASHENEDLERVFETQLRQLRGSARDARQVLRFERPAEPAVSIHERRHEPMFACNGARRARARRP
jgi:hypothetical protein